MPLPVWPAELPQFVLAPGYSEGLPNGRLFSRTDTGPGKTRRRYSSAVRPISAQIYVESFGWSHFERFWNETTRGGALPFSMPDQSHDRRNLSTETDQNIMTQNSDNEILVAARWIVMFGQEPPVLAVVSEPVLSISFTLNVMP